MIIKSIDDRYSSMLLSLDVSAERNNRLISTGITALMAVLLLLVFLFVKFSTPIPVGEKSADEGWSFGLVAAGISNRNIPDLLKNAEKKTETNSRSLRRSMADMLSSDEAINVPVPPVNKTTVEAAGEPFPQPDQNLLNVLDKKSSAIRSSTDGYSINTPGPPGSMRSKEYQPTGIEDIKVLISGGRKMIGDVAIDDNSQETGIVEVEILVDRYGKIIKAEPVLMGSTTTSSVLWKKAKDGLINQKLFNESASGEEASGMIYINFTVR